MKVCTPDVNDCHDVIIVPSSQRSRAHVTRATRTKIPSAAWLVLSGASAGGFALSFVFLQWFLHAGDFWRTPVLVDLPVAVQCFERDVQEEPQQVSQPGAEGPLSHVTGQHNCGILTA